MRKQVEDSVHRTELRKEKRKGKGERYHNAAKKMPLVSGMIPGDGRSVPGIEKAMNADKTDVFAKRVVKGTSLEDDPSKSTCGVAYFDGVGLQRFWHAD